MHYVHDVLKNLHIFHPFKERIKEERERERKKRDDRFIELTFKKIDQIKRFLNWQFQNKISTVKSYLNSRGFPMLYNKKPFNNFFLKLFPSKIKKKSKKPQKSFLKNSTKNLAKKLPIHLNKDEKSWKIALEKGK
jgi:hypothetical protein